MAGFGVKVDEDGGGGGDGLRTGRGQRTPCRSCSLPLDY